MADKLDAKPPVLEGCSQIATAPNSPPVEGCLARRGGDLPGCPTGQGGSSPPTQVAKQRPSISIIDGLFFWFYSIVSKQDGVLASAFNYFHHKNNQSNNKYNVDKITYNAKNRRNK